MDIDYSFYVAYAWSFVAVVASRPTTAFPFSISELPGSISQATQFWW